MTHPPRRVLLSRQTREAHAELLEAATVGHAVQWVLLDEQDAAAPQAVHAAFISRDVTGLSTKQQPLEMLARSYAVLRASPDLSWVQAHSAGADRPIYPEMRARGVAVTTASGANAALVATTALAGLLGLSRRFPQLIAAQHERRWAPLVGAGPLPPDLFGQTALLVGWGPIAQAIQPHLTLLGMKVVVMRRSGAPVAAGLECIGPDQWRATLPRADWLLLCCPLTPETRGLVDSDALARLPAGAHVVNVARGEVVVQAALVQALQSGHLGGAYLDVFEHEPLPVDSPLWGQPGVIVTPHSAGQSAGHAARVAAIFADNLGRWLRGQPLQHTVA